MSCFVITKALKSAAKWLPAQRPIEVFVHHNTLHEFEDRPFEDAVEYVAETLQTNPYMTHEWYIERWNEGRLTDADVEACLDQYLRESAKAAEDVIAETVTYRAMLKAALKVAIRSESQDSLTWLVYEGGLRRDFYAGVTSDTSQRLCEQTRRKINGCLDSLDIPTLFHVMTGLTARLAQERRMKSEYTVRNSYDILSKFNKNPQEVSLRILWQAIQTQFKKIPGEWHRKSWVPRDWPGLDSSLDESLISFVAAYLDDGLSYWSMPKDKSGFLATFLLHVEQGERFLPNFARWIPASWKRDYFAHTDPCALLEQLFTYLGIPQYKWDEVIFRELKKFAGWAGTLKLLAVRNDSQKADDSVQVLAEFLAVRFLLEVGWKERTFGRRRRDTVSAALHPELATSDRLQLFQILQICGIDGFVVHELSAASFLSLVTELKRFDDFERRRILHQAYERNYYHKILSGLIVNSQTHQHDIAPGKRPLLQACFCIDEREESLRRHLEEVQPECETFGVAGFFGIDMLYQGILDDSPVPLCPASVTPHVLVKEDVDGQTGKRSSGGQTVARHIFYGSRALIWGQLIAVVGGVLASLPLTFKILAPGKSSKLLKKVYRKLQPPVKTKLAIGRARDTKPTSMSDYQHGFSFDQMAERVASILTSMGLTRGFARLVFMIGHGSQSLNNPHESAHDCGACSGRRGGPNARAFAQMANRPEVRNRLRLRGIDIPLDTVFVGGYHDTCSDEVLYFDLSDVPESHRVELAEAIEAFDQARINDAHERCRRFDNAAKFRPQAALRHVEGRAHDLREPRPEYGHATNSLCIIGKRSLTRGLFLDRRSFLVSYDAANDSESAVLLGLMNSVLPVCAGINLEYYFSFVDNKAYGCGTKLPHNVVGLIGVMDGYRSDLRTGLPWQMVEIHEPVRLLVVVQASQASLKKVIDSSEVVGRYVNNGWVRLAVIEEDTGDVAVYDDSGEFIPFEGGLDELPVYSSSSAYFQNSSSHLSPVRIVKGGTSHG
jgi:hypothetical protein